MINNYKLRMGRISQSFCGEFPQTPYIDCNIIRGSDLYKHCSQAHMFCWAEGYTSISVREPLSNIRGHVPRRQELIDSHYATVSDDSGTTLVLASWWFHLRLILMLIPNSYWTDCTGLWVWTWKKYFVHLFLNHCGSLTTSGRAARL